MNPINLVNNSVSPTKNSSAKSGNSASRFETLSSSDICLLLIGQCMNFRKERAKLLSQIADSLDHSHWCMIVMQAIQQALDTNFQRVEDGNTSGLIPSKAIYRLLKLADSFDTYYQKLLVSLWNSEVTKLEMTSMESANRILSPKYRIKISFIVFEILKDLIVDSKIFVDELHTLYIFLQLTFVSNFSLLHNSNWISSLLGRRVLCPMARTIMNDLLLNCHDEVYREICLYIFNNPEMMNAANLIDSAIFKTISSRFMKYGTTKTIIVRK